MEILACIINLFFVPAISVFLSRKLRGVTQWRLDDLISYLIYAALNRPFGRALAAVARRLFHLDMHVSSAEYTLVAAAAALCLALLAVLCGKFFSVRLSVKPKETEPSDK